MCGDGFWEKPERRGLIGFSVVCESTWISRAKQILSSYKPPVLLFYFLTHSIFPVLLLKQWAGLCRLPLISDLTRQGALL